MKKTFLAALLFFYSFTFSTEVKVPRSKHTIRDVGYVVESPDSELFADYPLVLEKIKFGLKGGILTERSDILINDNQKSLSEPYVLVKVNVDRDSSPLFFSLDVSLRVSTEEYTILYDEAFGTGRTEDMNSLPAGISKLTRALSRNIASDW
ncbi:MAG: hypothetical protein ACLFQK_01480 [Fibrobacterota bacterium]